jgi:uncharacterized protein YceH (UPF0502 family)
MRMNLDEVEVRILGCLVEKALTTPENYPLSLNSLTSACNQKSNRAPLMSLAEPDVVRGLDQLGSRGLARHTATGGRVAKYRHCLAEQLGLPPLTQALLSELLLRGPQTTGELRTRVERMVPLADLAAVEETIRALMEFGPPLVTRLPRSPGHKDQRYAQLFAGELQLPADATYPSPDLTHRQMRTGNERLARLQEDLAALSMEVASLKLLIDEFKAQLE